MIGRPRFPSAASTSPTSRWSYASGKIDTLPDFADTLLVTDRADPTVLAHELGHTLAANRGSTGCPGALHTP
jgi:hypothetical protein